jgi:hypothetical protein
VNLVLALGWVLVHHLGYPPSKSLINVHGLKTKFSTPSNFNLVANLRVGQPESEGLDKVGLLCRQGARIVAQKLVRIKCSPHLVCRAELVSLPAD